MNRPRHLPIVVRLGVALALAGLSAGLLAGCGVLGPSPEMTFHPAPAVSAEPSLGAERTLDPGPGAEFTLDPGPGGADDVPDATADPAPAGGGAPDGLNRSDWVGTWRGDVADSFGISQVETVFEADASFNNQVSNPGANYLLTIWGQWDVLTFADGPVLRFTVEGWDPREFCGPVTCTAVSIPTGVSQRFQFLDHDTLVLTTPNCSGPTCTGTYYRQ
jgi:hypothetical protein